MSRCMAVKQDFKVRLAEPVLGEKELEYVSDCVRSSWISSKGRYIEEFENGFSRYCGTKHGIATSSGTAALHLAFAAIGVGPGDEVIVPSFTMIASANAVAYTGAKPIFVDSEVATWTLDAAKVDQLITATPRAIQVVNIYGHPADMDPLLEIASKHDLYLVEDACEAHGAEYKGRRVGSIGRLGCFSCYANKIITTGEGGMVVTDDSVLSERCASLRNLCFDAERRFVHGGLGFNYRMTNLQAAVGCAQLERIDEFIERRIQNARWYNSILSGVKGIVTPPETSWAKNVHWMYSILVERDYPLARDQLMQRLASKGIESRVMFNPMHKQKTYRQESKNADFPVANMLGERGMNLPSGNGLSRKEVGFVAESISAM